MSEDAIHRAARWQAFYEEEDGLRAFFDEMRTAYVAKAGALMPNDTAALFKLGLAAKLVDEIETYARQKIDAGKIAMAAQDHAERIAKLPEARRRFF
jgi:hypothetical protein